MGVFDAMARNWKVGRVVGAFLLAPILIGLFYVMLWIAGGRQLIVLTAPRDATVHLDDEIIPKKSATNFTEKGGPLEYRFGIDEGEYSLRVAIDETDIELEKKLVIDLDQGDELHIRVLDDEEGIRFNVTP